MDPAHHVECAIGTLSRLPVLIETAGFRTRRIPRACVIIPGFGAPEVETKTRLLYKNIRCIRSTLPMTWLLVIFVSCYSEEARSVFRSTALPSLPSTWWFVRFQPSFMGEFFLSDLRPETILDPFIAGMNDRLADGPIMILLDDVELVDGFHIGRMYRTLLVHDLHILSPVIDRSSASGHKFMFALWPPSERVFRRTNYAEMFFYMMTVHGYRKWHALLHPMTVFMWGIDMILYPRGLRIGIDETFTVQHHFCSKLSGSPHYRKMQAELRMYSSKNPDNIKFKFKNLWIEKTGEDAQRLILIDPYRINPRYEKLERITHEHT